MKYLMPMFLSLMCKQTKTINMKFPQGIHQVLFFIAGFSLNRTKILQLLCHIYEIKVAIFIIKCSNFTLILRGPKRSMKYHIFLFTNTIKVMVYYCISSHIWRKIEGSTKNIHKICHICFISHLVKCNVVSQKMINVFLFNKNHSIRFGVQLEVKIYEIIEYAIIRIQKF